MSLRDYRDLALHDAGFELALADERIAELRERNRQLVDVVADVTFENMVLQVLWGFERLSRIHCDKVIERLRSRPK